MSLPRVSIVVLGYLETNRPYLEACLKSVENLDYPKELLDIVVVSPYYDGLHPRIATPKPGSFSRSVNAGVRACKSASEFILILSDDTIIARSALKNMVETAGEASILMGALSNCDNYWKYQLQLPYIWPNRFYKFKDISPGMQDAESYYPGGVIMTDTLCFYAVLIPRKVWAHVGELDEAYNMGYEDTDYCKRAAAQGIRCAIALNAIIWHAGGASESIITDEMRESNQRLFNAKWAIA